MGEEGFRVVDAPAEQEGSVGITIALRALTNAGVINLGRDHGGRYRSVRGTVVVRH